MTKCANEMIERVARAMAENAGFCWENCAQSQWMSDARAGIKAMREPNAMMLTASIPARRSGNSPMLNSRLTWHAMIDGALRDEVWATDGEYVPTTKDGENAG